MKKYYDYEGNIILAPDDARTCYDGTGKWRTHRLFASDSSTTHQALTLCGRRAGAIPGGSDINCPECIRQ
jgi:hypothetical protein